MKPFENVLAGLWLLCLVLTLLDAYTPLQLTSRTVANVLHGGIWLLILPATHCLPLPGWLPRLLWWGLQLLVLLWSGLVLFAGVDPFKGGPLESVKHFFWGTEDENTLSWENAMVLFRRRRSLVVTQYEVPVKNGEARFRRVQITPLTPLLRWVWELPEEALPPGGPYPARYQGWTPVFRFYREFSFDPAEQRRLNAQAKKQATEDAEAKRRWEASPYYHPPDK